MALSREDVAKIVVNGDRVFTAEYNKGCIIFVDVHGKGTGESEPEYYPIGSIVTESSYPEITILPNENFLGWEPTSVKITGTHRVKAQWERIVTLTYTLVMSGATSAPSVTIDGKSVAVISDGNDYKAIYKLTGAEGSLPDSVTAIVTGGLPSSTTKYGLDVSPTEWDLSDTTLRQFNVSATSIITTYEWESGATYELSANTTTTANVESNSDSAFTNYDIISYPSTIGIVSSEQTSCTFSASTEYSGGKIIFAHSKDATLQSAVTVIAKVDEGEDITECSNLTWSWNGPTSYAVPSTGGTYDVLSTITGAGLSATASYSYNKGKKYRDGSITWTGSGVSSFTSSDIEYSVNPTSVAFSENFSSNIITSAITVTSNIKSTVSTECFSTSSLSGASTSFTFNQDVGKTVQITWISNGVQYSSTTVYVGAQIVPPSKNPTLEGKTFVGWSDTDGGTEPISSFPKATSDDSYYAIWSVTPYELYFTDGVEGTVRGKTAWTETVDSTVTTFEVKVTSTYDNEDANWVAKASDSNTSCTADTTNHKLIVQVPENTSKTATAKYVFTVQQYTDGQYRGLLTFTLQQNQAGIIIVTCDYLSLTYNWTNAGSDLDTATVLVTPNLDKSVVGIFGKTKTKYLEFAGDNKEPGNERVLVKIKDLKSYIEGQLNGKTEGQKATWCENNLSKDSNGNYYAQMKVYANWFVLADTDGTATIKIDSNLGASTAYTNTSTHEITFSGGETKEVVAATPVNVNAASFANANQLSKYVDSAYTQVAEIRYYIESNTTAMITNTMESCTFTDKIGAHVNQLTLDGDDTYFIDCTMVRYGSAGLTYGNCSVGKMGEYIPSGGTNASFIVNAEINNLLASYKITTSPDTSVVGNTYNSGDAVTLAIPEVEGPTTSGMKILNHVIGEFTNYPWLTFYINNRSDSLNSTKSPYYTNTANMYQICPKIAEQKIIYMLPSNASYILYDSGGTYNGVYFHTDNEDDLTSYTDGTVKVYVKDGTCSDVTLSIKSGDSTLSLNPVDFTNVGTSGSISNITLAGNTTNTWKRWDFTCSTEDSNYTWKGYTPIVYQEGKNPLRVYSASTHDDSSWIKDYSGLCQAISAHRGASKPSFYPDTIDIYFNSTCDATTYSEAKLYFNKNVIVTGVDSKINADNEDYSEAVDFLHLKCTSNYDSTNYSWKINVTDGGYNILVRVRQDSK